MTIQDKCIRKRFKLRSDDVLLRGSGHQRSGGHDQSVAEAPSNTTVDSVVCCSSDVNQLEPQLKPTPIRSRSSPKVPPPVASNAPTLLPPRNEIATLGSASFKLGHSANEETKRQSSQKLQARLILQSSSRLSPLLRAQSSSSTSSLPRPGRPVGSSRPSSHL